MKDSVRRRSSHFWRSIATLQTQTAARAIFTTFDHFHAQVESSCKNLARHFLNLSRRLQASMCPYPIPFPSQAQLLIMWRSEWTDLSTGETASRQQFAKRPGRVTPSPVTPPVTVTWLRAPTRLMQWRVATTLVRTHGSRLSRKRDSLFNRRRESLSAVRRLNIASCLQTHVRWHWPY